MQRFQAFTAACLASAAALIGCGGGASSTPAPSAVWTCDKTCSGDITDYGTFTVSDATVRATPLSSARSLCLASFTCRCLNSTPTCTCRSSDLSSTTTGPAEEAVLSENPPPPPRSNWAASASEDQCLPQECTEDASQSVVATAVTEQFIDFGQHVCENTPMPSYQAFTHVSSVSFRNTHPSRPVAVSWVLIDTSNAPSSDQAPCQGSACDNVLGRCFAFLLPGETSPSFIYNCDAVSNSTPVVDGTNVCVSGPVQVTMRALAMASFCSGDSPNKAAFCEGPSRSLQENEAVPAPFVPIELTGCPAR